jgi:hypothetical protein
LIVIVAAAFVAGCGDDGTSQPVIEDEKTTQGVFTFDRHSLMMIRAWSFSPELTYATGYFVSIAKLTRNGAVMEQTGGLPLFMDIWASSPSDIFAVGYDGLGSHGVIFHYNGSGWTDMKHPLQNRVNGVFGSSRNNVFAVGEHGKIAHYNGSSWSLVYDHAVDLTDGWASTSDTLFVVGEAGAIFRYDGIDWVDQSIRRDLDFLGIWGSGPSDVYALGDSSIYYYDGTDWTLSLDYDQSLIGIDGVAFDNIYAVGDNGTILHYGGFAWTPVVVPGANQLLTDVSMSSDTEAVIVGAPGTVLRLSGIGWSVEQQAENLDWQDVSGSSPNAVYAVAAEGTLAVWDGSMWEYTETTGGFEPTGVWGASPNQIWMCGTEGPGQGVVYFYDGAVWEQQFAPGQLLNSIWGTADDDIYVVGDGGLVAHFVGLGWKQWPSLTSASFRDAWSLPRADVFVVGDEGTIFQYDGSDWNDMSRGGPAAFNAVYGTSAMDVLAVGDEGLLLRYDGYIWRSEIGGSFGGFPMDLNGVWAGAPNDYWAIGRNGFIFRYDGAEWRLLSSAVVVSSTQRGIWGSRSGDIFICGSGDFLARYTTQ